jgi:glucose/mannose transport system permease protein
MAIAIPSTEQGAARRRLIRRRAPAAIALIPAALTVIIVYLGCMAWTVALSFTSSKMLPRFDFAGLAQYERLFANSRFLISIENLVVFGVLFLAGCLVLGFLLAVFIDQRVRAEGVFRTIYLYPHALSFIVTGLVWQWFLNPTYGLQQLGRNLGFETFTFDWLVNRETAIYTVVIAGIWQSAGLIMAILLAGLRGVDNEIYKAARVDGIPIWRFYLSIVLPIIRPMVITATVLLALAVVKVYDLVVAMTRGGPGNATEVPAKFVMDHLFERQNVGLAMACATFMLVTVIVVLTPWLYAQYGPNSQARGR